MKYIIKLSVKKEDKNSKDNSESKCNCSECSCDKQGRCGCKEKIK
jgi:hypothetical protein